MKRIVLIVELDPEAPLAYVEELSRKIKEYRWVEGVTWELQDVGEL